MITVRTKSSSSVKEVVRFFNRNFPEAVLKVRYSSSARVHSVSPQRVRASEAAWTQTSESWNHLKRRKRSTFLLLLFHFCHN